MSNRAHRRTHHHRPQRSSFASSEFWAVQPAWCSDDSGVEEIKQATHDQLIGMMGRARTGGVKWLITREPEKAIRICEDNVARESTPEARAAWSEIARLLHEEGGIMVLATAPGDPTGAR